MLTHNNDLWIFIGEHLDSIWHSQEYSLLHLKVRAKLYLKFELQAQETNPQYLLSLNDNI